MDALLIAVGAFVAYLIAYHTYGKWLARKIFRIDPKTVMPSEAQFDNVDYVPTKKHVLFGHHFTSIAGTGPIVGPAIAVFWGWLPALLWVVFGSIFIGAVHDFSALLLSSRNRGQTVGELAGRLISPRGKMIFLLILFFALMLVIAIFGLVIAAVFKIYPASVLPIWAGIPVAIVIGFIVHSGRMKLLIPSILVLGFLYSMIYVGSEYLPISVAQAKCNDVNEPAAPIILAIGKVEGSPGDVKEPAGPIASCTIPVPSWAINPTTIWTVILLIYCFIASVLPVWMLLQPRDYVNSHQLFVAMALLIVGLAVAACTGQVDLTDSAPAIVPASELPEGAPPIFPFLFITVACGAVSGFHSLVGSGTSSKQLHNENDALYIGYGGMLLESMLAVLVILACCAGVTMGVGNKTPAEMIAANGTPPAAAAATEGQAPTKVSLSTARRSEWRKYYDNNKRWDDFNLGKKVGSFVDGGANFIGAIRIGDKGIDKQFALGIMAVLICSFAATTLDTATRLQRYVVQELGGVFRLAPLKNKYVATGVAVVTAGAIALLPGPGKDALPGTGGLILWPLFGAVNQLLACLALLAVFLYLWRRRWPSWFLLPGMAVMLIFPGWGLCQQVISWYGKGDYLLVGIGTLIAVLLIGVIIEGLIVVFKAHGVLEEPAEASDGDDNEKDSGDGDDDLGVTLASTGE